MSNPFSKYLYSSQNRRNIETHPKRTVFLTKNNNNNIINDHNNNKSNNFMGPESKMEEMKFNALTNSQRPELNVTSMPLTHSTSLTECNYYERSHEEFPFSPNGTNSGYEQILERRSRDAFNSQHGNFDHVSSSSTATTIRAALCTDLRNNGNTKNDKPESKRAKEEISSYVLQTESSNSQTVLCHSTNSENVVLCNDKTNTIKTNNEKEKEIARGNAANSKEQQTKYQHSNSNHDHTHKSSAFQEDDHEDDDDDELHLLLGSQEARRVKADEKSNVNNANGNVHTSNTDVELLANTMESQFTALPTIAELPWQSRSHNSL